MTELFWLSDHAEEIMAKIRIHLEKYRGITASGLMAIRKEFSDIPPQTISEMCGIAEATRKAELHNKSRGNWWFTRETYEQSTAPIIAQYHASRFKGCRTVVELCTGSGMDTSYIAEYAASVITYEADELTAAIAQRNFMRNGLHTITVIQQKAEEFLDHPSCIPDGVWADPARRDHTRRFSASDEYLPPLSLVQKAPYEKVCGIKIAPGFNEILAKPWKKEVIGYKQECREIVLWNDSSMAYDILVTRPDTHCQWHPTSTSQATLLAPEQARFLVEPHPALIRSGALGSFYFDHSISVFDNRIAYGISESDIPYSPWYERFTILDMMPYHEKTMQKKLRDFRWSHLTEIKKRGFFTEPDILRKKFTWSKGQEKGVIITTRCNDTYIVFFAQRTL